MDEKPVPDFLECQQVRQVDQYAIEKLGIEGLVLMENAARGCVDLLEKSGLNGPVVVVCGKGNNGGDGFAIVRHLLTRGYPAKAILLGDASRLSSDARANYSILQRIGAETVECVQPTSSARLDQFSRVGDRGSQWVVDAILGTGTTGIIRSPLTDYIKEINSLPVRRLAVDIPSGIQGDTGEVLGCAVRADVTGTFVAKKRGMANPDAAEYLGKVHVLDIGIPTGMIGRALAEQDAAMKPGS